MNQSTCRLRLPVSGCLWRQGTISDRPVAPLTDNQYEFRSGAELGKILNEMAHIPYHWYDDTPISFEEEAFLIPNELLTIPLGDLRTSLSLLPPSLSPRFQRKVVVTNHSSS